MKKRAHCAGGVVVVVVVVVIVETEQHTSKLRNRAPAAMAVVGYVIKKLFIFIRRPKPFPQLLFIAARVPSHEKKKKKQRKAEEKQRRKQRDDKEGRRRGGLRKGSGGESELKRGEGQRSPSMGGREGGPGFKIESPEELPRQQGGA